MAKASIREIDDELLAQLGHSYRCRHSGMAASSRTASSRMQRSATYLTGVATNTEANGDFVRLQVASVGGEFSKVLGELVCLPESGQDYRVDKPGRSRLKVLASYTGLRST